jgi:hypothetical protein
LTDNLIQVTGSGYSMKLFLIGQLDDVQSIFKSPRKYTSVDITYIIKHFTHVIQILSVSTWWAIAASHKNGL